MSLVPRPGWERWPMLVHVAQRPSSWPAAPPRIGDICRASFGHNAPLVSWALAWPQALPWPWRCSSLLGRSMGVIQDPPGCTRSRRAHPTSPEWTSSRLSSARSCSNWSSASSSSNAAPTAVRVAGAVGHSCPFRHDFTIGPAHLIVWVLWCL